MSVPRYRHTARSFRSQAAALEWCLAMEQEGWVCVSLRMDPAAFVRGDANCTPWVCHMRLPEPVAIVRAVAA